MYFRNLKKSDMCLLGPSTLTDKRIEWEIIDPLCVNAIMIASSASLIFSRPESDFCYGEPGSAIHKIKSPGFAGGSNFK
jgi:hypothetical protein